MTGKLFEFIGEAYVHGIMHGELLSDQSAVADEIWLV
jgi:hypothetical protein